MWPKFLGRKAAATDPERWLVLDVESSGLDASTDRLLALAAVAVRHDGRRAWIDLADSFEAVLRQPADAGPPDKSNILVHGIGVAAQGRGIDPAAALGRFEVFVGDVAAAGLPRRVRPAPDRPGHARQCSGAGCATPGWTSPTSRRCCGPVLGQRTLDDWLGACGIDCAQRHQAAADTLATAELLLHLWPAARAEGVADFRGPVAAGRTAALAVLSAALSRRRPSSDIGVGCEGRGLRRRPLR